jgi:hypothetical protein
MTAFRIDEQGRWGGRLTSRPLPERDDAIERLEDDDRARLVDVWMGRAATERRVSDSFTVIRDALRSLHASGEALRLAERAIDDELRHAEICRYVASRFHGAELPPPAQLPLVVPRLEGATPELRHTLHVVGQCSLNETTASAFLEACNREARGELAQAALRELLSDEIDHARIGWMHLASVTAEMRGRVGRVLLPMARANLKMWRQSPRPYGTSDVFAVHGAPSASIIEEALVGSIRDLVIPGFAMLGIATAPVEAWVAAGAPTDD